MSRKIKRITAILLAAALVLLSVRSVYAAEIDESNNLSEADGQFADDQDVDGEAENESDTEDADTELDAIVAALNGEGDYDLSSVTIDVSSISMETDDEWDAFEVDDSEEMDSRDDESESVTDWETDDKQDEEPDTDTDTESDGDSIVFTANEDGTFTNGEQSLTEFLDGLVSIGVASVEGSVETGEAEEVEETSANSILMQRLSELDPVDGVEPAEDADDDTAGRPDNLHNLLDGDLPDVDESVEVQLRMRGDDEDDAEEDEDEDEDIEEGDEDAGDENEP